MRKIAFILLLTLTSSAMLWAGGGEERVSTKIFIVDAQDGSALIGATVTVVDTGEVYYTDPDGAVELKHDAGHAPSLNISYVSFADTHIVLATSGETTVALQFH